MHCAMIQTGDLQAIIGDAARDGVGGRQYCGVWSLTSKHWPFNAFGTSYAGLIPTDLRGREVRVEQPDETAVILTHAATSAYPCDAQAVYRLTPPHYLDHELRIRDQSDLRRPGCAFREVAWCSYLNCPDDPRLHFLSDGQWTGYLSPRHGIGSQIAPGYVPDGELEVFPPRGRPENEPYPFHWDRAALRFDRPFYYGRLGPMILMHLFDQPRGLRFFCSPTGGGGSLLPGHSCPAWDFEWIIPASGYAVGREYVFRLRLVYKRFESEAEVPVEYAQAGAVLNFAQTG